MVTERKMKIRDIHSFLMKTKFDSLQVRKIEGKFYVIFPNGRKQRFYIIEQGKYYSFRSVILNKSKVKQYYIDWLLPFLWQQNKETPLVSFQINEDGRLIGKISQLIESLDRDELLFYIEVLAKECDRLEYALTGKDNF